VLTELSDAPLLRPAMVVQQCCYSDSSLPRSGQAII
jgi:hypothetical protein